MARALGLDLRERVVAAIEGGLSTRAAARRFSIGISTAGSWYRQWRSTGDLRPGRQGQPSRSKVDVHEAFILDLVSSHKDIALHEIAERLAAERGVRAVPSTVWHFLAKRGITYKKRQRTPASNNAPTSSRGGTPGSRGNPISTRNG